MWISSALRTFNNYRKTIVSNSDTIIISQVGGFVSAASFRFNTTDCPEEFQSVFKHFGNLKKSSFEHFERHIENLLPRRILFPRNWITF